MHNPLVQEIEKLLDMPFPEETILAFKKNLESGKLTRDENPENHFCAYFAAYDSKQKKLFIGHHIKSGLWLFNGGHIDKNETLRETVEREIDEEWGLNVSDLNIGAPAFISTAEIDNPTKQTCRLHLDIWHFIDVNKDTFNPDPLKLAEEFHSVEWVVLEKARQIITDKGTLQALDFIEKNYFIS